MSTCKILFLVVTGLAILIVVITSFSEMVTYDGHCGHLHQKAYHSPDGKMQATLSNYTITLRDVMTGEEHWSLGGASCLAFSPDGNTIATGTDPIKLVDVATGESRGTLQGQGWGILCVAFSPDGKSLASGSIGNTLWLWDVESGERRFLEHPWWLGDTSVDYPTYVAFSPDGKTLAAVVDEWVGLWEVESGKLLATLDRGFRSVTIAANGTFMALSGNHQSVRFLLAPTLASRVGVLLTLGAAFLLVRLGWRCLRASARSAEPTNTPVKVATGME